MKDSFCVTIKAQHLRKYITSKSNTKIKILETEFIYQELVYWAKKKADWLIL